jgi:hypothetical protein
MWRTHTPGASGQR